MAQQVASPTKDHNEIKIIDIEITSSSQPPSQITPKVKVTMGSSSVGNPEILEDNKSSETVFSGRHIPDAYNSILRPKGIELYGCNQGAATPKLELEIGKDENFTPQKQDLPGTTTNHGMKQQKLGDQKDLGLSERYGGTSGGEKE